MKIDQKIDRVPPTEGTYIVGVVLSSVYYST